ncbi:MAG: helicase, partial [Oscillospiraceae bacterium]|nr:helicase [Oscillospiraceae bacterium]
MGKKERSVDFADEQEVYTLLSNKKETDYIEFNFPLLKDCLPLCNCMVSAKCVEITPPCVPIHKIRSFVRAKRKIFMSATLLDDSAFVTALDIKPEKVDCVISPEKANDIGDRLILFPQVMNKDISDQ